MVSIDDLFPFSNELGYLGILIISFIGSIIVFVPVPYFPVLITAALSSRFDPHIIALSSATGAVIAKTIIFFASYYGRKILSDKTKNRMLPLQRLVSKYGWPGAFIASLTPIPDDLVYIPLGLSKYSPWKFVTATFAGKLIMSEFIVWGVIYLGRPAVSGFMETTSPQYLIIAGAVSVVILGVIIYYFLKIDWAKIIGKYFPWTLKDDEDNDDKNNNSDDADKKTPKS